MRLTFAEQLNKMITAGLGGAVEAPETGVAVGRRTEWTEIGPAELLTFESNAELPFRALSVDLEPIQDLHGQAAPYPPGGGKNLLPYFNGATSKGVTFTVDSDGVVTANGTATSDAVISVFIDTTKIYGNCLFNGAYGGSDNSYDLFAFDAAAGRRLTKWDGTTPSNNAYETLEEVYIPENGSARFSCRVKSGYTADNVKFYPMLCRSTETNPSYAPYSNICPISGRETINIWREATYDPEESPAITIQLGQTVYGGTVDVVRGVMTLDRAIVDLGSLEWSKFSTADGTLFRSNIIEGSNLPYTTTNFICSNYAAVKPSSRTAGTISCSVDNRVDVIDNSYSDVASFKTAMSGVQLCYELAQPITITLTPEELSSLVGTNNVWSDADSVSLTYGNIYYTEGY